MLLRCVWTDLHFNPSFIAFGIVFLFFVFRYPFNNTSDTHLNSLLFYSCAFQRSVCCLFDVWSSFMNALIIFSQSLFWHNQFHLLPPCFLLFEDLLFRASIMRNGKFLCFVENLCTRRLLWALKFLSVWDTKAKTSHHLWKITGLRIIIIWTRWNLFASPQQNMLMARIIFLLCFSLSCGLA